jgi:hypothetical protein
MPMDCDWARQAVYRAVYYFNLFDYPVKLDEVAGFSGRTLTEVAAAVSLLESDGLVERDGDYVFIHGRGWTIRVRHHGEAFFRSHYKQIRRAAWWLSHMPFVRGILLTGRASKGLLSEFDDFDFLILAAKERARLAWILLFLLRRIVSLNFRNGNFKYFCCNYVLSEDNLALKERDPFLAMELVCAVPMFRPESLERFRAANDWHRQFFLRRISSLPADLQVGFRLGWLQSLVEIPLHLIWRPCVRQLADWYYLQRWLKLGMVKDEQDYREKASDGYVKPDTGNRRKFIIERIERLDPGEHQSFLRTKIQLHRSIKARRDAPDLLLVRTSGAEEPDSKGQPQPSESLRALHLWSAELSRRGYRSEVYAVPVGRALKQVFSLVRSQFVPLVALDAIEGTQNSAARIIELFHSIGARVVVVGPEARRSPRHWIEHEADVVVLGDELATLCALMDHIAKGTVALESIPGILYSGKE